jgi:hypothetical protein
MKEVILLKEFFVPPPINGNPVKKGVLYFDFTWSDIKMYQSVFWAAYTSRSVHKTNTMKLICNQILFSHSKQFILHLSLTLFLHNLN